MIVLGMVFFMASSRGVGMKYPWLLVFSRSLTIEWE
jgi:hypothetical protein